MDDFDERTLAEWRAICDALAKGETPEGNASIAVYREFVRGWIAE